MDSNDGSVVMDDEKRTLFRAAIEDFGTNNMHSVAIAFKEYDLEGVPSSEEALSKWELPGNDLTLLALVALEDPSRPGMKDLVKKCQVAGVKIRLITDDNLQRAKAIALECGILDPHDEEANSEPLVIEGARFRSLSPTEREMIAERIVVMGSSSPSDKLLLVQSLKKLGQVVAVTGSTPNDASPLDEADVGIAMNLQGTHAAKESSDVIIMDDNFGSIVELVRFGRSMLANIQNHLHFQLTVTIAAIVINLLSSVFWGDAALNVVQLLWIGSMVEWLGALAFITEPPIDELMGKRPIGRREHFLTNVMWRNLLIQVFYQVSIALILGIWGSRMLHLENDLSNHATKVKSTMTFNIFVLCQIFNIVYARKHDEFNIFKGIHHNIGLMVWTSLLLIFQVMIILYCGFIFNTTSLNLRQWIISIVWAFISFPLGGIGKCLADASAKLVSFSQKVFPHRSST